MESTANQLYVVWQDSQTRLRHVIGELVKGNTYQFNYNNSNLPKLKSAGFNSLIAFPDLDKTYSSEKLFSVFVSRLPDKRRGDINEILSNYDLSSYDEFELLKKSGGKLPTDSLEFVEPIDLSNKMIKRQFYIAGTKYYAKNSREALLSLRQGMELSCRLQPDNEFDEYAVQILSLGKIVGYIPSYFSVPVTKAIMTGRNVCVTVLAVKPFNEDKWCEYAKVELIID